MARSIDDPEVEEFKEHLEALLELAEDKECVYTMEFLSIALDCFQAERNEYIKRRAAAEKNDETWFRHIPPC